MLKTEHVLCLMSLGMYAFFWGRELILKMTQKVLTSTDPYTIGRDPIMRALIAKQIKTVNIHL